MYNNTPVKVIDQTLKRNDSSMHKVLGSAGMTLGQLLQLSARIEE
jgi:hypothetical protein